MKTQLDYAYDLEQSRPDDIWFSQPMGGGRMLDLTFAKALDEARRMAAHLASLNLPAGSRVAILSKNTAWWIIADAAIWMAGHVSVPIYPTLSAKSTRQILEHSEATVLFVGKLDAYAAMNPGIPATVRRIVMPLAPADASGERWDDIVARTPPIPGSPRREPDDLATIIYTSGSTGEPKGVRHSFRTMCAAHVFVDLAGLTSADRLISYLPLAHVAERALLETSTFKVGFRVFFAESLDTFIEDVKRARPTIFGSVPRLWLKLQAGVHAKMPPKKLARLLRVPILRRVIGRKVLTALGLDQVRWACTGSAPTPPEVSHWYGRLGLQIRDIYGMTENFVVSHGLVGGQPRIGFVGPPLPGVEQRIAADGEILVKSPGRMLGYYKSEELTKEMIDAEGWIHTGDRGEVDAQGHLRITGRVKELFKTSKGKYVAPAPIESALLASTDLEQACVTGVDLAQPIALVVLSEAHRPRSADAALRAHLTSALAAHLDSVNAALDPHERLDRLVVMSDEWTIDNGLLTPTLKVKRGAIDERYAPSMSRWAAESQRVVWS